MPPQCSCTSVLRAAYCKPQPDGSVTVVFVPADGSPHWKDVQCEIRSALSSETQKLLVEVLARPAQNAVRNELLGTKDAQCAITKTTLPKVLDAAHVIDLSDHGATTRNNMLLLRADIHRLFDCHLIKINPTDGAIDTSRLVDDLFYGKEVRTWRTQLTTEDFARVKDALQIRAKKSTLQIAP